MTTPKNDDARLRAMEAVVEAARDVQADGWGQAALREAIAQLDSLPADCACPQAASGAQGRADERRDVVAWLKGRADENRAMPSYDLWRSIAVRITVGAHIPSTQTPTRGGTER